MQDYIILEKYGEAIKVLVRKSVKAKRVSLRITYKVIELVLPCKIKAEIASEFLFSKEPWLRKKLQNTTTASKVTNNNIPIFGRSYNIIYSNSNNNSVQLNRDTIEVYAKEEMYSDILAKFLKDQISQEITKLTNSIVTKYSLDYTKIRITSHTSKWGSCSSNGILSFNWRLIFATVDVLKYVVIHEICHLKEMNHSKNFWGFVSTIDPNYSISKLWLRKNGHSLYRYLPEIL